MLEAPKRNRSLKGSHNPNWRGGKTFCKCGNRINSNSKTCSKCRSRKGSKNPFYGRKHTEEFKKKLSDSRKGTYKGNQEKAVIIDKVEYKSVSEAARQMNVTPNTIINRIRNKNFPEYSYK